MKKKVMGGKPGKKIPGFSAKLGKMHGGKAKLEGPHK